MSDAQEIQTGHAGASRCSAATKQSQLDAGDTGRSADALALADSKARGLKKGLSQVWDGVNCHNYSNDELLDRLERLEWIASDVLRMIQKAKVKDKKSDD